MQGRYANGNYESSLRRLEDWSWHLLMLLETSGPTPRARKGTMAKSCSRKINTVIRDTVCPVLPAHHACTLVACPVATQLHTILATKACYLNSSMLNKTQYSAPVSRHTWQGSRTACPSTVCANHWKEVPCLLELN